MFTITSGVIKRAQKVVIYGSEGIGKTTLASKFPNPIFIDTEGGSAQLDVARLPQPTSWQMLLQEVDYISANPLCETLVIDTADWAEKLCMQQICAKHQVEGIEGVGYGKGYTYLEEEFGRFLNRLSDLIDRGINVVITAHSFIRKFEQPDEMGAYDRWELKLQKKTAPLLKEWADMLLFCNYETIVVNVDNQGARKGKNKAQGGKRVMYTSHTPTWDAKNRHGLPPKLDMDYSKIEHIFADTTDIMQAAQGTAKTPEQGASPSSMEGPEPIPAPAPKASVAPPADIAQGPPRQLSPKQEVPGTEITDPDVIATAEALFPPDLDIRHEGLLDLMLANDVSESEIRKVVGAKGYYPVDTPINMYDDGFIEAVLIQAWTAVYQMIEETRKAGK